MSDVCCIGADKLRRMTAFVGSAKIYRKGSDYLNDNNYDITKYLPPYVTKDDCLYERKSGTEIIRLADFVPLLKSEVTYDDGIEQKKQFRIGGVHCTGEELPEVTVSADDMSNMRWLLAKWGVLGATQPGKNTLSKIGHAILCTRENVTKETVYLQTGWHKIGREYFFLLPCKDSEYKVELTGKLADYHSAEPCCAAELIVLKELLGDSFASKSILYPLLAVTFLSPLNHFLKAAGHEPKFVTVLVGRSGSGKSTLAALFLSFFGSFSPTDLPMSFHDTANSILANVYYLKDVLTCIDDLHPSGLSQELGMKETAQNISRFYGDRIGRARLNSNFELQSSRPPMGNALITAEYVPEISESGNARFMTIEVRAGDVNFERLERLNAQIRGALLCKVMRSYTDWIKETFLDDEKAFGYMLGHSFAQYRNYYRSKLVERSIRFHNRVPEMLAHIRLGFDFMMMFLGNSGALTMAERERCCSEFDSILLVNISDSAELIGNETPTVRFVQKLKTLLSSSRCYVERRGQESSVHANGFIGFEDNERYYLLADAAHSEVRKLCAEQGEHFSITKNQLLKQLADEGILLKQNGRNTTTIRTASGKPMSVIVLDKSRTDV